MSEENKVEETKVEAQKPAEVIAKEGKGRKILKWVGAAAALLATAVVGFLLGRGNEDEAEEAKEETEETKE